MKLNLKPKVLHVELNKDIYTEKAEAPIEVYVGRCPGGDPEEY